MPTLREQVRAILPGDDVHGTLSLDSYHASVPAIVSTESHSGDLCITYGKMYETPDVSTEQMLALRELFGASNIILNDTYANSGCESCDYGSDYGHYIHIVAPTKHLGEKF